MTYSIIAPVYNCASFLQACVASILDQECVDYELLLIDDGSTDGSGSICDSLATQYTQIHTFHKANGGASEARNYGLNHAHGDYVIFIDGDDTIAHNSLEALQSIALPGSLGIFGMSFDYYKMKCLIRSELLSVKYHGSFTPAEVAAEFSSFFTDNQLSSACNKLFDRQLIERLHLRFENGMSLYEDFDFVMRYLPHAASINCLPVPLYHYRQAEHSTHLNQRIADLSKLQKDLTTLSNSLLAFYDCHPEQSVLNVAASLYMQFLDQHLLQRPHLSPSELQLELSKYCGDEAFAKVLAKGGKLSVSDAALLQRVHDGDYALISSSYRKRQQKLRIKQFIKKVIGR